MARIPDPPSGHGLGPDKTPVRSGRTTWLPLLLVLGALVVGLVLFNATRAQPNYQEEEFTPDQAPPASPTEPAAS